MKAILSASPFYYLSYFKIRYGLDKRSIECGESSYGVDRKEGIKNSIWFDGSKYAGIKKREDCKYVILK